MQKDSQNSLNPKQGLIYFIWIMLAWTLYVLFIYPNVKTVSFFPYKIIGETFRILIFAVPVFILSFKLFDKPLDKLGITKNVPKGILFGLIIGLIWFSFSLFLVSNLQTKQINFSALTTAFWLTSFSISTFVEELGFRAFMLQSFEKLGKYFAIIASSVAFVVIHYPAWLLFDMMPSTNVFISASVSIFLLGIVLGIVFLRVKSIWSVVIIHAFNNLAAALMN